MQSRLYRLAHSSKLECKFIRSVAQMMFNTPLVTLVTASILCCVTALAPIKANAACSAVDLYPEFSRYRLAINQAKRPEDLQPFFSQAFKDYYSGKQQRALHQPSKARALTEYWDNLNRGAEIVSVYQQRSRCKQQTMRLELIAHLQGEPQKIGQKITLWRVDIEYVEQNGAWLINNFEFNKLRKAPSKLKLLQNFSSLRNL